jgi:tetratricopeptide (TPR) repeat protein
VPFRSALRAAHAERAGQLALDFRHEAEPAKVIRLTTARRRPDSAAGARDPHDAERLFLAASALDDGDPAFRREAADAYLQVLALDPTLAPALINLGNLHYADDRLADAQVLYERALTLEPDVFEAHYNLGNIHHDLGRFEEARRSYVRALALNPTYADGHFYLAVTLEKLGRSSEAKLHWRAYQQLAPGGEWIELAREFSE